MNYVRLLKKPKEGGYYEFSGNNEDLIITQDFEDSVVKNKEFPCRYIRL